MLGKKKPARKNRYKKRIQQKRRRLLGRLLVGAKLFSLVAVMLTVSAIFVVGYAAVTQSDYFSTRSIQVRGPVRLSEKEVLKQAFLKIVVE